MAVDMFIDMGGKIKGESVDKQFKDKIDVLAWSWGMSQSSTGHVGSGSGGGKATFNDLSFTKYVDKATHSIMESLAKGSHIDECKLTCRKAGEGQQKYLEITMKQVFVTSLSTGGSEGEDRLTEHVTLNFGDVTFDYFVQDTKGTTASAGAFHYDIAKNAA